MWVRPGVLPFKMNALKAGPVVAFRQNNRARGKRSSLLVSEGQCRKKVLKDVITMVTAVFEIWPKVSRRIINLFLWKYGKENPQKSQNWKKVFFAAIFENSPSLPTPLHCRFNNHVLVHALTDAIKVRQGILTEGEQSVLLTSWY